MGSASDTEIDYLSPSFDPASLTVPKIRAILVSHDISYPASAKKPQLIDIFTQELVPRSRRILAARSRTQRTSRGITDMPSSQEGTIDGDDETDRNSMPPPPVPEGSKRRSRTSGRETTGGNSAEPPINRRSSVGRRASGKHARPSDTEAEPEPENKRPLVRKTRKSEVTPSVKVEESENGPLRPSVGESAFSHDNPFQSGSSPLMPSESRRTSGGASVDRRKSSSRRRKIEGSGAGLTQAKQDDGIVVPSVKTFELPLARFRKSKVKDEQDDEVENGEEFTLEEQLELVREGTAIGNKDILPARKNKRARKSNSIPKSAPWVVLMTLLSGYAMWWRREKLEVGYCGIGRPSILLENFQIPEWARSLQPDCEPCPQHAICYERMETKCEQDFVLQPHPLSLGGLVPLPPSCEPDGEKVRRVKVVADKAIEELRERKANWECGTLVDNQGKSAPSVEVDETLLKEQVGKKRRRGMTDAEFEDLWKGALGEIIGREEIVHSVDGSNSRLLIASTSLNRVPLGCALRRSLRLALARYRIQLTALTTGLLLLLYARYELLARRASRARVPALMAITLDRLATQAALYARGDAAEEWISVGQLRDDVLRDEFSAKRREDIWRLVKSVVEMNANVRASVREGRGGEVSRVWEWIGSVGHLADEPWSNKERRRNGNRVSFGGVLADDEGKARNESPVGDAVGKPMFQPPRKWDEGRPIY